MTDLLVRTVHYSRWSLLTCPHWSCKPLGICPVTACSFLTVTTWWPSLRFPVAKHCFLLALILIVSNWPVECSGCNYNDAKREEEEKKKSTCFHQQQRGVMLPNWILPCAVVYTDDTQITPSVSSHHMKYAAGENTTSCRSHWHRQGNKGRVRKRRTEEKNCTPAL